MLDLFSSSSSSSRGSRSIPVTNCYTSAQPHYHGASRSHRALSLFTDPMSIGRVSSFFHSGERVHHNDCVSLEDKAIIIITAHYCYEAAVETPLLSLPCTLSKKPLSHHFCGHLRRVATPRIFNCLRRKRNGWN